MSRPVENPSTRPRSRSETFGCGIPKTRATSVCRILIRAARTPKCMTRSALSSASSGRANPRSLNTFPLLRSKCGSVRGVRLMDAPRRGEWHEYTLFGISPQLGTSATAMASRCRSRGASPSSFERASVRIAAQDDGQAPAKNGQARTTGVCLREYRRSERAGNPFERILERHKRGAKRPRRRENFVRTGSR